MNELEMLGIQTAVESPLTAEVADMFALSDAHAEALYPAESNHMVNARHWQSHT